GPQGRLAREFAAELAERTGLDVRLWDERLSSFAADEALAGLLTRKKRKARQDAVAAAEILRHFLAAGGPQTARRARDERRSGDERPLDDGR
ncbi:MAG: Holliday junction resolvase RuvX, partial [Planctomycetes bacterium]|nr:Holliday junction resolvase RuvX [Planctomycetota bacterium]